MPESQAIMRVSGILHFEIMRSLVHKIRLAVKLSDRHDISSCGIQ